MGQHHPDVVIGRLRAEREQLMSMWEEALGHLVNVGTSTTLTGMLEQVAVEVVTRELDKGATALWTLAKHWGAELGIDVPDLPVTTPAVDPAPIDTSTVASVPA